MNLKITLAAVLLILNILGLIMFGYAVYAIYSSTTNASGANHLKNHQVLLYLQLVVELLQVGFAGLAFYKI